MFGTMTLSEINEGLRQAFYRDMDDPVQWLDDQIRTAREQGESVEFLEGMRRLFDGHKPPDSRRKGVIRKPRKLTKAGKQLVEELEAFCRAAKKELADMGDDRTGTVARSPAIDRRKAKSFKAAQAQGSGNVPARMMQHAQGLTLAYHRDEHANRPLPEFPSRRRRANYKLRTWRGNHINSLIGFPSTIADSTGFGKSCVTRTSPTSNRE